MLQNIEPKFVSAVLPIEARGVSVTRGGRTILNDVNLQMSAAPNPTVILGPNGAGKSLLVRLLGGLLQPDAGTVMWRKCHQIGRVPQRLALYFSVPFCCAGRLPKI